MDRRFANGFALTTAYTYGKSIDSSGAGNGGLWVYINSARSRARADGHRRHLFVQNYIYELPFGKGKRFASSGPLAFIVGGWQVNGLLTLMTGEPFNLSVAGGIINAPGNANTPNRNGQFKALKAVGPGTHWFDPSVFGNPATGTFGNFGRVVGVNGAPNGPREIQLGLKLTF
jgi:hypothetical protein